MLTIADILAAIDAQKRAVANKAGGLLANPMAQIEQNAYQGVEDIQRDPMGTAMGLLTFAGVGAKTANKGMLAKAQEMTKAGADPTDVWRTTGWTDQFPDRKWRFEIPDNAAGVWGMGPERTATKGAPLAGTASDAIVRAEDRGLRYKDVIQHQNLYDAYPDFPEKLASVRPMQNGQRGELDRTFGIMSLDSSLGPSEAKSTSLHELQHAIQQREGFARGGSPQEMSDYLFKKYAPKVAELKDRADGIIKELGVPGDTVIERRRNFNTGSWDFVQADKPEVWGKVQEARRILDAASHFNALPQSFTAVHDAYRNLAGEAEARLTQQRMNLTPEQRLAQPPWLSFDVPPEQQIVRGLLGP